MKKPISITHRRAAITAALIGLVLAALALNACGSAAHSSINRLPPTRLEFRQDAPTGTPPATATQGVDVSAVKAQLAAVRSKYPVEWPMPPLTDEQIAQAEACHVEDLAAARYKDYKDAQVDADLTGLFAPLNACDWATLAFAYADRVRWAGGTIPDVGYRAYLKAINDNPAYMLISVLFYGYMRRGKLVKAPPFTDTPLKSAMFSYSGHGWYAETELFIIRNQGGVPLVSSTTFDSYSYPQHPAPGHIDRHGTLDPDLVRGLGQSLTDLIPIGTEFGGYECSDYYPVTSLLMVYQDGTTIYATTHGNAGLGGGGPWELTLDGQPYIQASDALPAAVDQINAALKIPYRMAGSDDNMMMCIGPEMLPQAFLK